MDLRNVTLDRSSACSTNDQLGRDATAPGLSGRAPNTSTGIRNTVPLRLAEKHLGFAFKKGLHSLTKKEFIRGWCSLSFLYPGLHPDGFEDADSGWPRVLQRFAAEAWRRAESGELEDHELYACDAQWSGLYDRMNIHLPDETERRLELAAAYGERGQW